ncbi:MAG: metallophosphoesterase family protein [Spirochaetota bacterium]
MKILCVADHIDPLVYSAAIKQRFADVDLVLAAGDLPMEYLGFISASLNKPIFFVFGNHHLKHLSRFRRWGVPNEPNRYSVDPRDSLRNYFGSTYVGSRVVRYKGLIIGGMGGCRRYNRGENQFTERQMFMRIVRMVPALLWHRIFHGRAIDIFLTHASPFGINDRSDPTHVGFKVFRWFLRTFKPRYQLHGHVHLYDLNAERVARYEETTIINVYDHYLLEIPVDEQ